LNSIDIVQVVTGDNRDNKNLAFFKIFSRSRENRAWIWFTAHAQRFF